MKDFKSVLKEINRILDEILVFDIILNSVIIFLTCYLGLMLLSLNPWYALFPTLAYFIALLFRDIKKNKYMMVEEKYTPLYEKLRTSVDNADVNNEVVEELKKEVINDLRNVKVSSFVRMRRITAKVFSCVFLCFIILLLAMYGIQLANFNLKFEKVKELIYGIGKGGGDEGGDELTAGSGEGDENIYGREHIAKLGKEELKIKIKMPTIETISEIEEPPEREFEEAFPDEIFTSASGAYEEKIAIENQKLVKEYFKKLSEG